jgi:hypothetical protein
MSDTGVAVAVPQGPLWRVARRGAEFRFSQIDADVAADSRLGNRFDIPGWGVLYAASRPEGAFAEVLQGFRPTAATLAAAARDDGHMAPSSVPQDWREKRVLSRFTVVEPLPFVDVEETQTHTALTHALAPQLAAMGVSSLDVPQIRGANRRPTRLVA